ncbi:MAG: IPT/TIG domain-containing protein [bacterium]|nr:IPT/TIG domain-containing protein [bacterium]
MMSTIALLLASVFIAASGAYIVNAQTSSVSSSLQGAVSSSNPARPCKALAIGLRFGMRDQAPGGDIEYLQNFLIQEGYLNVNATGFFGPLTFRAVTNFQASNGISAIGLVGPMTRAAINARRCGNPPPFSSVSISNINPSSGAVGTVVTITGYGFTNDNTVNFGYGAIVHVPIATNGIRQTLVFSVPESLTPACFYSAPRCLLPTRQTSPGAYNVSITNGNGTSNAFTYTVTAPGVPAPNISSITPSSGPTGTLVTLSGSGFSSNDIVLIDGGMITANSIGSNQISFILPESVGPYCPTGFMCAMYMRLLTPGMYQISVKDTASDKTSNSVAFTITPRNTAGGISISGIDGPPVLSLGITGTWTVRASVQSNFSGNLRYSVVWGDENIYAVGIMAPRVETVQTSASFTHSYQRTGVYSPTFTVSDEFGHSATVSSSVSVTPLY